MQSDESISVNGQVITARDWPGHLQSPAREGGCFRHYEVGDKRFDSLDEAKRFVEGVPVDPKSDANLEPDPAKSESAPRKPKNSKE